MVYGRALTYFLIQNDCESVSSFAELSGKQRGGGVEKGGEGRDKKVRGS